MRLVNFGTIDLTSATALPIIDMLTGLDNSLARVAEAGRFPFEPDTNGLVLRVATSALANTQIDVKTSDNADMSSPTTIKSVSAQAQATLTAATLKRYVQIVVTPAGSPAGTAQVELLNASFLTVTNTAVQLSAQLLPWRPSYTLSIYNPSGGSLTLQSSPDGTTWSTLATVAAGAIQEVVVDNDYVRVSTAATMYFVVGPQGVRVLAVTDTAAQLSTKTAPFKPDYTLAVYNPSAGSLVLQSSPDGSTWATLATVPSLGMQEVTLNDDYLQVSTSATLYLVGK